MDEQITKLASHFLRANSEDTILNIFFGQSRRFVLKIFFFRGLEQVSSNCYSQSNLLVDFGNYSYSLTYTVELLPKQQSNIHDLI